MSEGEQFPADICILEISEGGKIAYVETKNIDGESNLKSKVCPQLVDGSRLPKDMIGWTIQSEPPSDRIYQFNGVLTNNRGIEIALGYDNFCLRGTTLRNTEYVVGVVTYAGKDTKVMRNSVPGTQKKSKLETATG